MPYIHVTRSPGMKVSDYEAVMDKLGPDPIAGQQMHVVGESDGALHIMDVWETRAHADRFGTERLFPAFAAAGIHPDPNTVILSFEGEVAHG